jgi:uncharacterized protein YacL
MFGSISDFYNTSNYLPILNSALIVDLIVVLMLQRGFIKSKVLQKWYKNFHLGAFMADVLSLVIGVVLARFIYTFLELKWNILLFLLIAVLVQLCHDLLFAKFFYTVPKGLSSILDVFKDYANELGPVILLADAQMIIGTVLLASLLANMSTNSNIVLLIFISYMIPYFIFSV